MTLDVGTHKNLENRLTPEITTGSCIVYRVFQFYPLEIIPSYFFQLLVSDMLDHLIVKGQDPVNIVNGSLSWGF